MRLAHLGAEDVHTPERRVGVDNVVHNKVRVMRRPSGDDSVMRTSLRWPSGDRTQVRPSATRTDDKTPPTPQTAPGAVVRSAQRHQPRGRRTSGTTGTNRTVAQHPDLKGLPVLRAIRNTAAVLAAATLVSLPVTATAADYNGPKVIVNNVNQFAFGDIFNAGHDNTVGSNDGSPTAPGVGVGVYTFYIRTGPRIPFMVGLVPGSEWPGTMTEGQTYRVNAYTAGEAKYEDPINHAFVTLRFDPTSPDALQCGPAVDLRCEVRDNQFLIDRQP